MPPRRRQILAWGAVAAAATAPLLAFAEDAVTSAHPGYVVPPALGAPRSTPWAEPPGSLNSFRLKLDLPEPDHYLQEVIRVVRGGFGPVTVTELAVAKPGEPVQVMVLHAPGGGRWAPVSRRFAAMPWSQFESFRTSVFTLAARTSDSVAKEKRVPGSIGAVCTDDGGGIIEYGSGYSGGLHISINGCGNQDALKFEDELLSAAKALTKDDTEARR